ncbi:hypothetical protein Bca4012_078438 [Brassica carinata]|uniref:Uncharacterized protein n=1 Tax=Brassica carinata TaxID=52824 RepID=A0A8X7U4T4_BRACI|nr:hypothetical protein Bca52824_071485 [Brassica carinata]
MGSLQGQQSLRLMATAELDQRLEASGLFEGNGVEDCRLWHDHAEASEASRELQWRELRSANNVFLFLYLLRVRGEKLGAVLYHRSQPIPQLPQALLRYVGIVVSGEEGSGKT